MVKVAVIGGSKHCANAMVVQGLEKGGYEFKLLLRTPSNAEYTEEQKSQLTIIQGDALDPKAVKETVEGTDVVVFAIGSAFSMTKGLEAPTVCKDGMKVLLDVLKDVENRPKRLVAISSSGLDGMGEVPFLLQPLYKWLLHEPHMDKRDMEALVMGNDVVTDYILVRPTLLTDGKLTGKYKAAESISGYSVSRKNVGHFLLHQCIEPTTWIKKKVVITN